jgi:hypothetical protein
VSLSRVPQTLLSPRCFVNRASLPLTISACLPRHCAVEHGLLVGSQTQLMTGKPQASTARSHMRACRPSNPCTSNKRVRSSSAAAPVQGRRPPEISALRSRPMRQILQIPCKAPPYSADEDRKLETRKPDDEFFVVAFVEQNQEKAGALRPASKRGKRRQERGRPELARKTPCSPWYATYLLQSSCEITPQRTQPSFRFFELTKTKQIEHRVKRAPEASRFIALSSRSSLRLIHPLRLASGRVPFPVHNSLPYPLLPSHWYLPPKE